MIAKKKGIYLIIPKKELHKEISTGNPELIQTMLSCATIDWLEPGETLNDPPKRKRKALYKYEDGDLLLPKGLEKKLQKIVPHLKILPGENGEDFALCLNAAEKLPVTLDREQLMILSHVHQNPGNTQINAAMGAGKGWILCALLFGFPLLRPAVVSGKGKKDTSQLIARIQQFMDLNPGWAEPLFITGMGKQLNRSAMETLQKGEGIVICTHAGLQNMPINTKLLIADECHALGTEKRIEKLIDRPDISQIIGLSGTTDLRGDGGDELIGAVIAPVGIKINHQVLEETKRVAPTQINAYHFMGEGMYAHNLYDPKQTPLEGYSFHSTWIENHNGRHKFTADLILSLPSKETKLIFVPHVIHAVRIAKALKNELLERLGNLTKEEYENYTPQIVHAGKEGKGSRFKMSDAEREDIVSGLMEKRYLTVFTTDFLAVGFDTNEIDHVIDASGEKAIIKNLQRSGRGTRPKKNLDGTTKINNVHVILDKTHKSLHYLGEKKLAALLGYYGHNEGGVPDQRRSGGFKRFLDAPWVPQNMRRDKLKNPDEITSKTLEQKDEEESTFDINNY